MMPRYGPRRTPNAESQVVLFVQSADAQTTPLAISHTISRIVGGAEKVCSSPHNFNRNTP